MLSNPFFASYFRFEYNGIAGHSLSDSQISVHPLNHSFSSIFTQLLVFSLLPSSFAIFRNPSGKFTGYTSASTAGNQLFLRFNTECASIPYIIQHRGWALADWIICLVCLKASCNVCCYRITQWNSHERNENYPRSAGLDEFAFFLLPRLIFFWMTSQAGGLQCGRPQGSCPGIRHWVFIHG